MRQDSLNYLKNVGIDFKPAESPDLWQFLENHLTTPTGIGHRFTPMSAAIAEEVIVRSENALLDALVSQHLLRGRIEHVTQMIEMPFIVGANGAVVLPDSHDGILDMINHPGTAHEHLVHVIAADPEHIPTTHRVTVWGGLYTDGHTAGFYDLCPGGHIEDEDTAENMAWLTPPRDILALALDMEENLEAIKVVGRHRTEAMIIKARQIAAS
jgi:hypothetical protein